MHVFRQYHSFENVWPHYDPEFLRSWKLQIKNDKWKGWIQSLEHRKNTECILFSISYAKICICMDLPNWRWLHDLHFFVKFGCLVIICFWIFFSNQNFFKGMTKTNDEIQGIINLWELTNLDKNWSWYDWNFFPDPFKYISTLLEWVVYICIA